MISWRREFLAVTGMMSLFILIYSSAILILHPFYEAGVQPAFENPSDPSNIFFIVITILVFTLIMLLIARFWRKKVIQLIILGAVAYTAFYAFFLPLFSILFKTTIIAYPLSIVSAIILVSTLYWYPEWYIVDVCGIIIGIGAIIIFGISLSIPLVIALLSILAVYDALSVYKTRHMVDLADTVMDLKLPVLLVIPKTRGYSLLRETESLKEKLEKNVDREAFFMGLGDVVIPGILVIAVYYNIPNSLPLVSGVIIGIIIGFLSLMVLVLKGKPQAGLPCLCSGAIIGYILSSILCIGKIIF